MYGNILQNYSHGKNLTLLSPLLEEVTLRRVLSQEISITLHPAIHASFTRTHLQSHTLQVGTSRFYMKVKRAGEGRQVARQARKKMAGRQAVVRCVLPFTWSCAVCVTVAAALLTRQV